MWSSVTQVLPNQVHLLRYFQIKYIKNRSVRLKIIDLRESHEKVHKKPSETLGEDSILRLEISIYCLARNFN